MASEALKIPGHVPAEVVVPYDLLSGEAMAKCPQRSLSDYRDRRILFSPLHGGFWTFTQYEDIRKALQDADTFGQVGSIPVVPHLRPSIPNSLNPPELQPWRQLLLPLFAPKRISALEPLYRQIARERMDVIAPLGRCEFLTDYAAVLPVWRFCRQLGLPPERSEEFMQLAQDLVYGAARVFHSEGAEAAVRHRAAAGQRIYNIMATVLEERRRQPGDDIASVLLEARMDDQPIDQEMILHILVFLFHAGTDSTSSAIASAMLYLATHPEERKVLASADEIPDEAIEELIRVGTAHHLGRVARRDTEIAGVLVKKGDLVALSTAAGSRDPTEFPDPDQAHLDRSPNRHLAFGLGAHRCLGVHQAHMELKVALEEFIRRIPEFKLEPGYEPLYKTALGKSSPEAVPLIFDPH